MRRFYAFYDRVLEGLASEILLANAGEHELQETLGDRLVVRGFEDARPGDHYRCPRSAGSGVVVAGGEILSFLGQKPEEVVVVYEADVDLTGGDGGHLWGVLRIYARFVGLHPFEPPAGLVVTPEGSHCGNHRLEGSIGRCPTDSPLPLGVDEVEDIVRQLLFGQPVGVIHHGAGPAGQADPPALWGTGPVRGTVKDLIGQSRQQRLHGSQAAGVLSEKYIRRCTVAFFQQRPRQLGRTGVFDLDLDSGDLAELLDNGVD